MKVGTRKWAIRVGDDIRLGRKCFDIFCQGQWMTWALSIEHACSTIAILSRKGL